MSIKERYNKLVSKKKSITMLEQAKNLRDQCVLEQNLEYYYLVNILIIDIFIEENKLDEAITVINKDFSRIDNNVFRNIYVSYLERLIYIYINKRNFAVAYRYVYEKRKYINEKNRDDVNRWYLEMAYVYAEMNQKAKAVDNLKAIIENLPSDELLSLALNNLTKLYIDQRMIPEAKDALNQSLIITQDEEGKLYCHYLFAKICILEHKYEEALVLFEDIFKNQINEDFLSIANDYIDLLIKMNYINQGEKFINKINKYIENSDDLLVRKEFYKNKLKLVFSKYNISHVNNILEKIDDLENTILAKNALDLEETYEDEKNNEIYNQLYAVTSKLDHVINLISIVFSSENINDILVEYAKKIETIINVEGITFVFYEHLINFLEQKNDITTYGYKKERLYERSITFENLKNTIVEAMINHGNEIIIDLNDTNLDLIDINTQKKYKDLEINYLYAIPNYQNEKLFGTVIYESKYTDLTALENNIILKVATKLLETKLLNTYLKINSYIYDFVLDRVITNNNIYTIIHNYNKLILSDEYKKLLGFKENVININDYLQKIVKYDVPKYQNLDFTKPNSYKLKYCINSCNRYINVEEKIDAFEYDKLLFFFSTIKILDSSKALKNDDEKFYQKILNLKAQVNNPEFKFSLIRLEGDINDYENIYQAFGIEPYYLSDRSYVVIVEEELNQNNFEKILIGLNNRLSIIRYPRDLVDIDEMIKASKIFIENNIVYFNDDIYQQYLKKTKINNHINKLLDKPLKLSFQKLGAQKKAYEVKCQIDGIGAKDNLRLLLDHDILTRYDKAIFNALNNNKKVDYYLNLTVAAATSLYENKKLSFASNIYICLDHIEDNLFEIIKNLKYLGYKIILDHEMLDSISSYDFINLNIDGLMINSGLDSKRRERVIKLASRFNLPLLTNYKYNDYQNCIYRTNVIVKEVEL